MAVEANNRSNPDITNSPSQPARSEAPFLDEDWPQFMAEAAGGPAAARHFTRAAGFCPTAAANIAANETNFAACRSAATA
jgi:hypothetical protein